MKSMPKCRTSPRSTAAIFRNRAVPRTAVETSTHSGLSRGHRRQLRLHSRAEIALGLRRGDVLASLPRGDGRLRRFEGIAQRARTRQGVAIERLAEISQIAVVGAAERGAIGRSRRDDDGLRVDQAFDEGARIAGRVDDGAPPEAGLWQ